MTIPYMGMIVLMMKQHHFSIISIFTDDLTIQPMRKIKKNFFFFFLRIGLGSRDDTTLIFVSSQRSSLEEQYDACALLTEFD